MKHVLTFLVVAACAAAVTLNAAEKSPGKRETKTETKAEAKSEAKAERQKPSPEQRQFMKELLSKYDANGDKKIDKQERAKITAEERSKMRELNRGQQRNETVQQKDDPKKKVGQAEQKRVRKNRQQ